MFYGWEESFDSIESLCLCGAYLPLSIEMVQRYIPAKIAPWQRKWKTLTYFIAAGAAYYFVFWQDWTRVNLVPPDHVFSKVRCSI